MPGTGAGTGSSKRDPAARDGAERAQRVRAGLTGLAAVLVVAGFAGAILNTMGDTGNTAEPAAVLPDTGNTATAVEASPNEPLAELGVAPAANAAAGTQAK